MKVLNKLFKLLIIMVLSLVVMELAVRATGMYFQYTQRRGQQDQGISSIRGRSVKKIMILGDSTAVMGGDSANTYLKFLNAYPTFLETYLNSIQTNYYFKVDNLSLMNGNTYRVLLNAQAEIEKRRPDIVISMLGIIDMRGVPVIGGSDIKKINLKEFSRLYQLIDLYLEEKNNRSESPQKRVHSNLIIDALRFIGYETNKNFNIEHYYEVVDGHMRACNELNNSNFIEAARQFSKLYETYGIGKMGLVSSLEKSGKFKDAEIELKKFIELKPQNPYPYGQLMALYSLQGDFEKTSAVKRLADSKLKGEKLSIDIEGAKVIKAKGDLRKSNEMLEAIRKRVEIDSAKKIYPFSSENIKKSPQMGKDFFANIESNDLYRLVFEGLAEEKNYKKLDDVLNFFTKYHPWRGAAFYFLLENYILYGQNDKSKTLLEHISTQMRDASDYYRLIVYYASMNKKLDPIITERFKVLFKNSRLNFEHLYRITKEKNIPLVMMQYPGFSIEITKLFLNHPDVYYLSNEELFKNQPLEMVIFEPRYPYVRNHYTELGSKLIAKNLGDYILNIISKQ